jgi:hypothetical protein
MNKQKLFDLKVMIGLQKKLKKWEDEKEREKNCGYALCKKRIDAWGRQYGRSFWDNSGLEKLNKLAEELQGGLQ